MLRCFNYWRSLFSGNLTFLFSLLLSLPLLLNPLFNLRKTRGNEMKYKKRTFLSPLSLSLSPLFSSMERREDGKILTLPVHVEVKWMNEWILWTIFSVKGRREDEGKKKRYLWSGIYSLFPYIYIYLGQLRAGRLRVPMSSLSSVLWLESQGGDRGGQWH